MREVFSSIRSHLSISAPIIGSILIQFFPGPVFSALPLHMEDAEKMALERNLEKVVREIELRQARAGEQTASLRANPVLEIDTVREIALNRSMGGSLTIPIDLSGRRGYRVRVAQETTRALQMDYRNSLRLLLRDVRSAYYDLLEMKEKDRISAESESTYRQLAELNQTRLHEQQISPSEASRSLIAWKQARLRRDEARLAVVRSRESLRMLIGAGEEIDAVDALVPVRSEPIPMDEVLKKVDQRSDLLGLRLRGEAVKADLELQKARAYPDFSLGISAKYGNSSYAPTTPLGFPFVPYHNNELGFFAQIGLPFFDRNQGEISRSELENRKMQEVLVRSRERVISEIRTAYIEYENARRALREYGEEGEESILARAGRTLDSARFAYRNGGISLLEYLDALGVHTEIRSGYVSAVSRCNRSLAALNAAISFDEDAP